MSKRVNSSAHELVVIAGLVLALACVASGRAAENRVQPERGAPAANALLFEEIALPFRGEGVVVILDDGALLIEAGTRSLEPPADWFDRELEEEANDD